MRDFGEEELDPEALLEAIERMDERQKRRLAKLILRVPLSWHDYVGPELVQLKTVTTVTSDHKRT